MKKLNGTITLSFLEEDNTQRVIFRIIPLCTKDGFIFQNRKASYPDFGSLRIIPDKREQSSFKERMREIGSLCCVQLYTEGKELTKVRQNRNYDPNQGECNQYAIYSDVICGFEPEAVFEVFQEDQAYSQALTNEVLIQRGMVLYGPVKCGETPQWDTLKPFGNENYLLQTVEDAEGNQRTYYWNPEAIVTWRQRKKQLKQNNAAAKSAAPEAPATEVVNATPTPEEAPQTPASQEQIPIGKKLDILDEKLTNDEQISELNLPISEQANRLERNEKPKPPADVSAETAHFHGTPIAELPQYGNHDKQKDNTRYHVVEKQISEKKSGQHASGNDRRHVQNPVENLKNALQDVWQIPGLHQELIRVLSENSELMKEIVKSPQMERQTQNAYTAAKAEMDEIEAHRLALLVELDKVKTNYQHTKEKMLEELTQKKQNEIANLEQKLLALKAEKVSLEDMLTKMGDQLQQDAADFIASKNTMLISSNGSELSLSPTIGYSYKPEEIVEIVRAEMNALGFMCNQDCVTEFLIHLSLFDEICIMGDSLCIDELYTTSLLLALGLSSVTAWPNVFGALHLVSLLPENDLRTPTIEVIKSDRIPIKACGHKTIRLLERSSRKDASLFPIIQVPAINKSVRQDRIANSGKPISLETLHAFSQTSIPLCSKGEAWFDQLGEALEADGVHIPAEIFHAMRMFARIAAPQLIGGFMEAADSTVLAWIVPVLISDSVNKENTLKIIGDLPRSRNQLQA